MYQKSFQKFEKAMDDTEEINRIKKKFQTKKVKIIKYNFQNGFIMYRQAHLVGFPRTLKS
jgi:hypothetical protein